MPQTDNKPRDPQAARNNDAPAEALQRAVSHWSVQDNIKRVLWSVVQGTAFRLSFHNWYRWRRMLLVMFGAKLAPDVRVARTARITAPWNLTIGRNSSIGDDTTVICAAPITIGEHSSISQMSFLVAGSHDYTKADMPALLLPITIEDYVWVAAQAFVCGEVTIAKGCIIGARSVVLRSTEPWGVYAGHPAKRKGDRRLAGVHEPAPSSS